MLRRTLPTLRTAFSHASSSRAAAPVSSTAHHLQASRPYTSPAEREPETMMVFGAGGGIGSALSDLLASSYPNAHLILADHGSKVKDMAAQRESMKNVQAEECDALDAAQVNQLIEQVVSKHKKLDAVACVVGNVMMKPASGATESSAETVTQLSDLEAALCANLYTSFNIVQASARAMQANGGGSIVLTSGVVAESGLAHFEAMSAAKGAVEALARSYAATYVRSGVRINCVAPGLTRTKQTEGLAKGQPAETSLKMHPVKHFAEPRDIAHALQFFMHPGTDMITGTCLPVDGGLSTLRLPDQM